jgi:hypothetical protein
LLESYNSKAKTLKNKKGAAPKSRPVFRYVGV